MLIETLTRTDQLQALEHEWRLMEPQMLPLPFVTYDWAAAWWQCLHSEKPLVRDHLNFLVFRDEQGLLQGVAPLMITHRPAIGPIRFRQLQWIGADTNITELRCVATPSNSQQPVANALLTYLQSHSGSYDWIKFTGISGSEQLRRVNQRLGPAAWQREVPDFILPLKPTWDAFRQDLPRNIKESLRKCYNAPKRDGVNLEFLMINQDADIHAAVDDMLRLHTARSKLTHTIAHPNVFASAASRAFLHEVCRRFAARDRLRIFQLKHENKIVATRIGFVCNDHLYLYYSGFDPEYAHYSVMTRVVAEAIQYAIGQGFAAINLSVGRDVSKERWRPDEINYYEMELVAPSRLSALKYRLARMTGDGVKQTWIGRWLQRGAVAICSFYLKLVACNTDLLDFASAFS